MYSPCRDLSSAPYADISRSAYENVSLAASGTFQSARNGCGYLGTHIVTLCHPVYQCLSCVLTTISTSLKNVWEKVYDFLFVRDEGGYFSTIVAYILAYGVIIALHGVLYGFTLTAIPLAIGLAAGFGAGILTGIFVVYCVPHAGDEANRPINSLLSIYFSALGKLKSSSTEYLVQSIVILVILNAMMVYPLAVGIIMGLVVGNHAATKWGFHEIVGKDIASGEIVKEMRANNRQLQAALILEHNQRESEREARDQQIAALRIGNALQGGLAMPQSSTTSSSASASSYLPMTVALEHVRSETLIKLQHDKEIHELRDEMRQLRALIRTTSSTTSSSTSALS